MRTLSVLALLVSVSLAASAQDAAHFDWQGDIQPGQALEIRNINGGIRAEPAEGPQAELHVRILGTNPPPETIRIDVYPHEGGILVCTIYQGLTTPEICAPEVRPSLTLQNSDIRVEYTLKVPAGVVLKAKTVNGRIRADLPESEIFAETVNGRIALATGKRASARAINGSIDAELYAFEGPGPREFRTVNGSVDLELPGSVEASVQAGLIFGVITTDFPLRVWRGWVESWMSGDLNGGGPRIELGTVNGSIHLRKQTEDVSAPNPAP